MITIYPSGKDFIEENASFLDENPYMSALFYLDAPLLPSSTKTNYAIKAQQNDKRLLAMKVEPYNLMLHGDEGCLGELLSFLKENDYVFEGVMCSTKIGEALIALSPAFAGKPYYRQIGMDFMEADEVTEGSSLDVEEATIDDIDEIYECSIHFLEDCHLSDKANREKIARNIASYRIIRVDGRIVSFANSSPDTEKSRRISWVYTRPEYRGQGYAREVVNFVKNEILASGRLATLNVDIDNPISNHLYSSLGFKKVFSQGIYLVKAG